LGARIAASPRARFALSVCKTLLRNAAWLGATAIAAACLGLAAVYLYLNPQIPTTDTYTRYQFKTPLRIYTDDGALIGEFGERLIPIDLADVPQHFIDALLNTEDKRFYDHAGIDLISLANDLVGLLTSDIRTGASTITMQLAKTVSFSPEQVLIRKLKEMLLALKIERELTKDEILELYVNIMAFGKHAYGVQAAALTYYGRPVDELNLAQLAMMAGIIKKPEAGNPINGPEWALARRNLVLRRMRALGSIEEAAYRQAVDAPITAGVFRRGIDLAAPYPAEWVRQQLFDRYGGDIYTGFEVYTTLDSKRQATAQQAVQRGLVDYDIRHGYRGPEGRIVLETRAGPRNEAVVDDPEALTEALAAYPASGGLEAAVVVGIEEQRARVMRANGETVGIEWEGLRWAPYVDTDRRGPRPERAAEVVALGDVVRILRDDEGAWRLRQIPEIQAALVALDPRNGAIEALVGGWDFRAKQFNHALQAARQPGSGFKPFVYSAALANGVTPSSVFLDAPLVFDDDALEMAYRPRNDSGRFTGPMRLREALARSVNVVSMRVMTRVGARSILDHVARFGFDPTGLPNNIQLAIGGGTMLFTPMDMAGAYAILANGGYRVEPHIIKRVERLDGEVVFTARHPEACEPCPASGEAAGAARPAPRVLGKGNAFIMDTMLRDVIETGTGRPALVLDRPDIAGKTGTADEAKDTWFNGYHPHLAATVWVGFSDHRPTGQAEYGSKTPLAIWIEFMREALADEPVVRRPIPEDVVRVKVNEATGRVAKPDDPDGMFEYFLADALPERSSGPSSRPEGGGAVRPEDIF